MFIQNYSLGQIFLPIMINEQALQVCLPSLFIMNTGWPLSYVHTCITCMVSTYTLEASVKLVSISWAVFSHHCNKRVCINTWHMDYLYWEWVCASGKSHNTCLYPNIVLSVDPIHPSETGILNGYGESWYQFHLFQQTWKRWYHCRDKSNRLTILCLL